MPKVGDFVILKTIWVPIDRGIVVEVDGELGFRIHKWWFGVHEISSIGEKK